MPTETPTTIRDPIDALATPNFTAIPEPRPPLLRPLAQTQKSPGTMTVTEALNNIHNQQERIKAALDQMISDAVTLRAQL
jgi:hypothetical protein